MRSIIALSFQYHWELALSTCSDCSNLTHSPCFSPWSNIVDMGRVDRLLQSCFLKHVSQANIVSCGIHVIAHVWCQPMWFVSNCCSGIISGCGQNPWQWWHILGCALQGESDAKIKFWFSKVPVATISRIYPLLARKTSQISQHMQLSSLNDKRHNIIISISDKRQITTNDTGFFT